MKINNCMRQYIDADYLDKLTDKERQWYIQFLNEYYYSRFKKDKSKHLHKSTKEKRAVYKNNYRIRYDIMYSYYYSCIGGNFLDRFEHKGENNEE